MKADNISVGFQILNTKLVLFHFTGVF